MAGRSQMRCVLESACGCSRGMGRSYSRVGASQDCRTGLGPAGRKWRQLEGCHNFGALSRPGSIPKHAAQQMDLAWYQLAQSFLNQCKAWYNGPKMLHSCGASLTNLFHQLMHHILSCHGGNCGPAGTCRRDWKEVHGAGSPKLVRHICHLAGKGFEMPLRQGEVRLVGSFCHAGKHRDGGNMCSSKGSVDALPRPELHLQSSYAMISNAIRPRSVAMCCSSKLLHAITGGCFRSCCQDVLAANR